ncbi:glycosyltransferase [Egbenema bharatensis]|uniref:glycosyltransferase n=1 Tax=Egbenema bharatensis TaxID=3463334 RepID=UPI003A843D24
MPSLFQEKGGIQQYSSALLQALLTLQPEWSYNIFLKHDRHSDYQNSSTLHFFGAGHYPLRFRTLAFATQLFSYGLWQSPELVISTHLNFTTVAHQLKQIKGIPYWIVAHGIEAWNVQRPSLQWSLHNADRILAVSEYTRDRLLKEQNLDANKIHILPNTFDAERFRITAKPAHLLKKYNLKPDQPIILTIARLSRSEQYKGYDQLLAALPQIRQVLPNIHYVLAGKGDDRHRIEQMITQLNLQDCVTLVGYVPDEELVDHYNLCNVFAMPSKGEGFGIVYLEAMACGKPVLAGNRDGALDALRHGELGVLVDPDNEKAIAQTLIQILQKHHPNPLLYQPEALRQKTIEHFGFERFQDTLSHYLKHYFLSTQCVA